VHFLSQPYNRNFSIGRSSEQLYNPELHKIYESVRHLTDTPAIGTEPVAKLERSMWHDAKNNALKWWDPVQNKWRIYYEKEFKITSEIMSMLPPENPIRGQLWIYNGVLCYYDGSQWTPAKALLEDGSQFSLDVFKNFLLISPLWRLGNTIVEDDDIAKYKDEERKYLQNILDAKTDSEVTGNGTKWNLTNFTAIENPPAMPNLPYPLKAQMLVPNIDFARMFLDHKLDNEKYEEISKVCIQYYKNDLLNVTPSLLHINPGRLSRIVKRIVKIDRNNPRIQISSADTEYYGFRSNEYQGDLLLPDQNTKNEDGTISVKKMDYTVVEDGILLSYDAAQNYDYVLAVHYDFNWMKSTGRMHKSNFKEATTSYYINGFNGPFNVFVNGYNYEDPYYEVDNASKTIITKENTSTYEVSVLHVPKREYGYIRTIDVNGYGVIRPIRDYVRPLVFMNGEALSEPEGDVVIANNGLIYVKGASPDMAWAIIDLHEDACEGNDYTPYDAATHIGKVGNDNLISYPAGFLPKNTDTVVLFVNGLLIKKEDIVFDRPNRKINVVGGLTPGQSFILVADRYGWLYNEESLTPALPIARFTDSLVYFNKRLICNSSAIDATPNSVSPVFNEVRNFKSAFTRIITVPNQAAFLSLVNLNKGMSIDDVDDMIEQDYRQTNSAAIANGTISEQQAFADIKKQQSKNTLFAETFVIVESTNTGYCVYKEDTGTFDISYTVASSSLNTDPYIEIQRDSRNAVVQVTINRFKVYDNLTDTWKTLSQIDVPGLKKFAYAYENMPRGIRLIMPYTSKDDIQAYAFHTASSIENPLTIRTVDVYDEDFIKTDARYIYKANTLRVWCNGIRQYPNTAPDGEEPNGIIERADGRSFKLPGKFTGKVTYIIELPENGADKPCTMEILDEKNIVPGYINVYKTEIPMFPGRVSVYVNGIRQPNDTFTIYDNYTLLINSPTPLIGNWINYPEEKLQLGADSVTMNHNKADKILVEIHNDGRQEYTCKLKQHPIYDVDVTRYKIPMDILEAGDEILIFANGLYFGGVLNGDAINGGYVKNISKGCITIRQEELLRIMNTDEEHIFLRTHAEAKQLYLATNGNKEYERHNATLTFEWR